MAGVVSRAFDAQSAAGLIGYFVAYVVGRVAGLQLEFVDKFATDLLQLASQRCCNFVAQIVSQAPLGCCAWHKTAKQAPFFRQR